MENSLSPWSWSPGPPFPSTRVVDPARTWNRRLWGGEIIFARATRQLPGRGDFLVSCTIEPPSSLSHTHVRAAFRHLRFEHPSIASQVAWSEGDKEARFMYEAPPDEGHVEAWLDATTFERTYTPGLGLGVEASLEHWRSELAHAQCPRTNHVLSLYHISPSGSNSGAAHGLLLYVHHSLFDGIAAWQVLDCVLSEVASVIGGGDERACAPLAWGEEYTRLARAVPDRTETKWKTEDMKEEWPAVKRMQDVLQRPSTSFGLPTPHPHAPPGATAWITRTYPSTLMRGLVRAAREGGAKLFALQFAMILLACLRVSPPTSQDEDHRITMPFNPVNLRPLLSVLPPHEVEIVSAIGFKALEATNLLRFGANVHNRGKVGDAEVRRAVLTLAREVQVQSDAQEGWQEHAARYAPLAVQMLGEAMFRNPPPSHPLKLFGITNFGVLDSIIKPSYPISSSTPSSSSSQLKVTGIFFHGVMFYLQYTLLPVILHAYTWQGVLTYAWSYSSAHMGNVDAASIGSFDATSTINRKDGGDGDGDEELLGRFIRELESIMVVLANEEKPAIMTFQSCRQRAHLWFTRWWQLYHGLKLV